jgi:lysophospholipase L1-like esterase
VIRGVCARLLVVALGLFGGLVLAEGAVRLVEGHPLLPFLAPLPYIDNGNLYRRTPRRLYELRPGVDGTVGRRGIHIHINAAGFRDDAEYPFAKPSGTMRVMVLGDSFTFGGKVALEETYPKLVGARLDAVEPERRHEVLNFAVPGYNTEQEALLLEERALAYEPDLILVGFVLNDAARMSQLVPPREPLFPWLHSLLKRLDVVQLVYGNYKRIRMGLQTGRWSRSSEDPDFMPGAPRWALTREALRLIAALASSRGARTLVVVWPMLDDLGDRYPHLAKHQLVAETCRELGIPLLDLLPSFRDREAPTLWAEPRDHHPNAEAQRIAADAIVAAIVSDRLLGPSGGQGA